MSVNGAYVVDMSNKATAKRTRIVNTRITEPEGDAWDEVCRRLGGDVQALSDADGLRHAMRVIARQLGVAWPGGAS